MPVQKREDFNKMLTGAHVPEEVGVKRYFPPRSENNVTSARSNSDVGSWHKKLAELDAIENSVVAPAVQPMQVSNNTASTDSSNLNAAISYAAALVVPTPTYLQIKMPILASLKIDHGYTTTGACK